LSFSDVSTAVRNASLDLPGGSVKTIGGEILIRTKGQRYRGSEFEKIVILTRNDGTKIYLSDIATVIDGFEDSDMASYFDGKRSVQLQVYRVGTQNLLDLVATVKQYITENEDSLPEGISIGTWFDRSKMLEARLDLLKRNALFGLVLVFIVLALFLGILDDDGHPDLVYGSFLGDAVSGYINQYDVIVRIYSGAGYCG
jgi:multidrug efflux pump subunit AcrB